MANNQNQHDCSPFELLRRKFDRGFYWALGGSLIFESLKGLHTFALQRTFSMASYGVTGTIFAMIYLSARIADMGSTNSLAPFLTSYSASKERLRTIFGRQLLLPLLATLLLGAIAGPIALVLIHSGHSFSPLLLFSIGALIFFEGLRSFLRQFLHLTFKSRAAVIMDHVPLIGYLLVVWGSLLLGFLPISYELIFVPFLMDSLLATGGFVYCAFKFYATLPITLADGAGVPAVPTYKAILLTKTHNWLFRLSREAFSSNVLTPLFAVTVGAGQAGLFYCAASIATSLQTVIKSLIVFPATAFLAHLKNQSMEFKQRAFGIIAHNIVYALLIPIAAGLIGFGKFFTAWDGHTNGQALALFFSAYLIVIMVDFFVLMYEQFFVIQQAAGLLLVLRIFELVTVYFIVSNYAAFSPISFLVSIVCVKLCGIALLAIAGYRRWGIKPYGAFRLIDAVILIGFVALLKLLISYVG